MAQILQNIDCFVLFMAYITSCAILFENPLKKEKIQLFTRYYYGNCLRILQNRK